MGSQIIYLIMKNTAKLERLIATNAPYEKYDSDILAYHCIQSMNFYCANCFTTISTNIYNFNNIFLYYERAKQSLSRKSHK